MAALLGVDLGHKRVGLAVSDDAETFAIPLHTYQFIDTPRLVLYFRELIHDRRVGSIIVGLPLNTDGTEGRKAKEAISCAKEIAEQLKSPIVMWDERYTTMEALSNLSPLSVSKKRIKKHLDSVAAQLILQSYLDNRHNIPKGFVTYSF